MQRSPRCRRQCQYEAFAKRGVWPSRAFQTAIRQRRAISVQCYRRSREDRWSCFSGAFEPAIRTPAGSTCMIRDGQVDLQHSHDRANQPFALAKRQSKHRSQSQRGFDGKVRIMTLTARRCSGLRLPTCNRIRRKPDCQASAITEANVIFAPVCNPMALARNMPSAFRMKLERHDRLPTRKTEAVLRRHPLKSQPLKHRCNKVAPPQVAKIGAGKGMSFASFRKFWAVALTGTRLSLRSVRAGAIGRA